jgi:predicted dehydrogenase
MSRKRTRREFMQTSAALAAGVGFWAAGGLSSRAADTKSPNGKINVACIGVGGKGDSDCSQAGNVGTVVALCDIDDGILDKKASQFPKAKKFNDFREMLDKMGNEIDAVTVSTADHTHAPASVMAMKMKKHVYCQKPLTHTVYEARVMRETAEKAGVCTQMGNQGTAEDGLRRAVEIVQAGVLGKVTEVHVWTNRPIWPQGAEAILAVPVVREAALAALHRKPIPELKYPEAPKNVHWDLFLACAPERPYTPGIHPFAWRGWWDYGTGALGDMACHTANMAFMALKLGSPLTVEAKDVVGLNSETYPTQAHVIWEFPARGDMVPLTMHWYEGQRGGRKMLPPEALLGKLLKPGEKLADSGSILVGDKGILFSPNDYGASYRLIGEGVEEAAKKVEQKLPRNGKGDQGMKEEWARAIMEGKPSIAMSNFGYAGLLTETILLGNVAMRAGKKLNFDAQSLKFTNDSEANKLLHYEYRKGWTL